ncbi:dihydroorotate dehydrogenase (quinone), partial [Candidatus Daviesbacteria bacterium RIFCSPLOWO2_01_FULL_37_10]
MEFYKGIVSPVLDHLDSETMHVAAKNTLHLAELNPVTLKLLEQFAYGRKRFYDPRLHVTLGGRNGDNSFHLDLDNPVMVGAGWDKTGSAVKGLWQLGFSAEEVGTVPEYPQPGNDKPRQFYHPDGTALNRLGFNSLGMEAVYLNINHYLDFTVPFGISIGKNKWVESKDAPAAHAVVAERFRTVAYWYAINVSSPNTPGLRALQDKGPLTDIVQAVKEHRNNQPIYVKIAPDLTYGAIDDVISVAMDNKLAGIIAANTTVNTELKTRYGWGNEAGGLSGNDPDFRNMSTKIIAHIYRQAGKDLDIIGIGGVNSAETALEKIKAGAKAVQVVTAIREVGPTLPGRINRGLISIMDRDDVWHIKNYVGINAHLI